jgi:hypothetical protein
MSSLIARTLVAASTALLCAAPALAQEVEYSPSNDQIDSDLDQALEAEYTDDHPPPPAPSEPGVVVVHEPKAKDDGRGGFRLRLMGAYWRAHLSDLRLSKGVGDVDTIKIDDFDDFDETDEDGDDDDDWGGSGSGHYELSLDFNRHVGLRGAFNHSVFKGDALVGNKELDEGFSFGNTTWNVGDELDARVEIYTADADVVLRPLNNRYINIDLTLGARYIYFDTELTRNGADKPERERLEAAVPVVGLALGLRPLSWLELFGRVRVGHLSYEVDDHYDWDEDDEDWDYEEAHGRDATSVEIDLGVQFTIADTLGIILGYRLDHVEIERFKDERESEFEATAHGFYAGLAIQFSD